MFRYIAHYTRQWHFSYKIGKRIRNILIMSQSLSVLPLPSSLLVEQKHRFNTIRHMTNENYIFIRWEKHFHSFWNWFGSVWFGSVPFCSVFCHKLDLTKWQFSSSLLNAYHYLKLNLVPDGQFLFPELSSNHYTNRKPCNVQLKIFWSRNVLFSSDK